MPGPGKNPKRLVNPNDDCTVEVRAMLDTLDSLYVAVDTLEDALVEAGVLEEDVG